MSMRVYLCVNVCLCECVQLMTAYCIVHVSYDN